MKRRLMLLGGMLVLIAAGSFTAAFVLMSNSINQDTFASIQRGMTEAEVFKLLQRPCDESYNDVKIWNGRSGRIGLVMDTQGTVLHKEFEEYEISIWLKMRRFLRTDPPTRGFQPPTSGPVIFPDRSLRLLLSGFGFWLIFP